jgi:predicted ATP-dependent serine protease
MAEAEKLGFETVVISKFNTINRNLPTNMQVVMLGKIEELYNLLF